MRMVLLVFVLAGYLVALVPARLCHLDIGSFRRSLWVGYGSRDRWLRGDQARRTSCSAGRHSWSRSRGVGARPAKRLVELRDELREVQREPERAAAGA